jgi:hypothetical protein
MANYKCQMASGECKMANGECSREIQKSRLPVFRKRKERAPYLSQTGLAAALAEGLTERTLGKILGESTADLQGADLRGPFWTASKLETPSQAETGDTGISANEPAGASRQTLSTEEVGDEEREGPGKEQTQLRDDARPSMMYGPDPAGRVYEP